MVPGRVDDCLCSGPCILWRYHTQEHPYTNGNHRLLPAGLEETWKGVYMYGQLHASLVETRVANEGCWDLRLVRR